MGLAEADEGLYGEAPALRPVKAQTAETELVKVEGFWFDPLTESQFAERIVSKLADGSGGYAVTINTDVLYLARNDPALKEMLCHADITVADGMPVVWASRLAGRTLPARVAGSSSLYRVAETAEAWGQGLFLLGGRPGAAEQAAASLLERNPTLRIGTFCPPIGFEEDPAGICEIGRQLEEFGPAVCFCAFGSPKQEKLIGRLRPKFPGYWFIGCGGTIDFAAGITSRAPIRIQRLGMEWAWRLAHEPRRLSRRYLRCDMPFATAMLVHAWAQRKRSVPTRWWVATVPLEVVARGGLRLLGRPVSRRTTG